MKGRSRAEKFARDIERWRKILSPKFPDIDPHDLDLIIAAELRTPKERIQLYLIGAKEAANRPKDIAHLQILKEAVRVKKEILKKRPNHKNRS